MTAVDAVCPECSAVTTLFVGQSAAPGHLIWSEALHCPKCKYAHEADGYGLPSELIRDAIVSAEGLWGLYVELSGSDRLSACRILRSELKTQLADVIEMKKRIPGLVYVGTRAEMHWLHERLAESEHHSKVEEVDRSKLSANVELPRQVS